MVSGTPKTREHYDQLGWKRNPDSGQLVDIDDFGVKEDGPIRRDAYRRLLERVETKLRGLGSPLKLLECGCGGNPAIRFLAPGDRYTGVDFSPAGLKEADKALRSWGGTYELEVADICRLPFADGQFDAVYSSHVLYHIDNPEGQAKALEQIVRVLRPGGLAVLLLANPYSLLFPIRFGKRLVAATPWVGRVAKNLFKRWPLPARPMSIGWYRRRLRPYGTIEVLTGGIPSTWFYQTVTEHRYPTKLLWQGIGTMDATIPRLSSALGCYFLMFFTKC
jgi:ubiquinone/menaquinone biosynthesis C-methylase UbiE